MQRLIRGCLLLAAVAVALIPREKLISESPNSASQPSLSIDGKFVGFIAPDADNNKAGVSALVLANNKRDGYVLIKMNDIIPEYYNVYKFDLHKNELSLIFTNKRFEEIYTDNNMNIRLAKEPQEDGSDVFSSVSSNANPEMLTSDDGNWDEYLRVHPDDARTTTFHGFDKTNENAYWTWGEDSDLGSLIVAPFNNISQRMVLHRAVKGELSEIIFHSKDHTLLACSENYHKHKLAYADATVARDLKYLSERRPEDAPRIIDISHDMQTWLVTYTSERPSEFFVYRREQQNTELLLNSNPELGMYPLNKQIGFEFVARDGLPIQAYISLPLDVSTKNASEVSIDEINFAEQGMIPAEPQKMVLLVHGGPQSRDKYGFRDEVAHLTSRGYAVLQVNFRGSSGFGKRLTNVGDGEWSRKMHTDLLDAVDFAVSKGIANRSEVAIMGVSYGGYATLVGLTFSPDVFACGVDIVGPSNLITLLQTIPPTWGVYRQSLIKQFGGDPDKEEGRQELIDRSPLFIADRVKKPLLVMQGANDPRVKQQESEQFVAALKNHSIPVTYVLYPDEGHGFRRTRNKLAQFGFVEKFLHKCLGGAYQPFTVGQYNETAIVKSA